MAQHGKGFSKRQLPNKMEVDANSIQEMQRGYEIRLARQRDSINRLVGLLEERTAEVAEFMRRANDAASRIDESDQGPLLVAAAVMGGHSADTQPIGPECFASADGSVISWKGQNYIPVKFDDAVNGGDNSKYLVVEDEEWQVHLMDLLKLIPEDWDMYNEYNSPVTALASYIKYCTKDAHDQRAKQEVLVKNYREPMDKLAQFLTRIARSRDIARMNSADGAIAVITQLKQELANATYDAQANAEIANESIRSHHAAVTIGDISDVPPPGEEPTAFVAPVSVESSAQIPTPIEVGLDREVLSWPGADKLMSPDEQRPGSF